MTLDGVPKLIEDSLNSQKYKELMRLSTEHHHGLLKWVYDLSKENKIIEAKILEGSSTDPNDMISLTLEIQTPNKRVEIIYLYNRESKSEQLHFMPYGGDDWCFHSMKSMNNEVRIEVTPLTNGLSGLASFIETFFINSENIFLREIFKFSRLLRDDSGERDPKVENYFKKELNCFQSDFHPMDFEMFNCLIHKICSAYIQNKILQKEKS